MSLPGESILTTYLKEPIKLGGFMMLYTATANLRCPVTGEDREILIDLGWTESSDQRSWEYEWWN